MKSIIWHSAKVTSGCGVLIFFFITMIDVFKTESMVKISTGLTIEMFVCVSIAFAFQLLHNYAEVKEIETDDE